MDLSKLPKMGGTMTPTSPAPGEAPVSDAAIAVAPVLRGDVATECAIAGILGLIFLTLGQTFGGWLIARLAGHAYQTNVNWSTGPSAGQPVAYFDLQGGTAWLEMGLFVLGCCLIFEAVIAGVGLMRNRFGKAMVSACLLLGVVGAVANIVAIVMQIQAGFTQPIMSMVALAVGVLTSLIHGRRLLT